MMFRCYDCGELFDDPKYVDEYRGEYWGTPAYERMAYCPCCGSEDFDEYDGNEEEEEEEDEEI